jgi:S1-C subfamily serine protease
MRAGNAFLLTLSLALGSVPANAADTSALTAQGELPSLSPMLEEILPGVVSIAVHGGVVSDPFFRRFFGVPEQRPGRRPSRQGSWRGGGVVAAASGTKIRSASDLRNTVGLLPIGTKVRLDVLRKGQPLQIVATLGEARPEEIPLPSSIPKLSGVTLGTIEPGSRVYGQLEGAVVTKLEADSPAAQAGLRTGDVIVGVNHEEVRSPEEVAETAGKAESPLLLRIIRGGSDLFIVIG